MTFFSIIVPVYNVENYIKQCVESILNQSFKNFELILVNDGSTDSSGEICSEYMKKDKRVKVIQQSNGGASKARNTGLKNALGEFVYFIDSDDYLAHNNVFEKIKDIILNDNSVDIIKIKQIAFKDNTDNFYSIYRYNHIGIIDDQTGLDAMFNLCETNQMVVSVYSYFIRKEILLTNNIYFIEGVYSEDINWIPRVFIVAGRVKVLDEFVYCRRQNRPGQITFKANLKRDLDCASILDNWFKQSNSVPFKNNINTKYFWNYLSNIYIGVISNQYLYKGNEAKQRIRELAKYKYILEYNTNPSYRKFNIIYKFLGFRIYVSFISIVKKIYRMCR